MAYAYFAGDNWWGEEDTGGPMVLIYFWYHDYPFAIEELIKFQVIPVELNWVCFSLALMFVILSEVFVMHIYGQFIVCNKQLLV